MEDEEAVSDATARMLTRLGCPEVRIVPDGTAALEAYREAYEAGTPFDLAIMDVTIPGGMGAEEAMARLLVLDPGARVIVASGYASSPVLAAHREHGFRAVLRKPFDLVELARAIRLALA